MYIRCIFKASTYLTLRANRAPSIYSTVIIPLGEGARSFHPGGLQWEHSRTQKTLFPTGKKQRKPTRPTHVVVGLFQDNKMGLWGAEGDPQDRKKGSSSFWVVCGFLLEVGSCSIWQASCSTNQSSIVEFRRAEIFSSNATRPSDGSKRGLYIVLDARTKCVIRRAVYVLY